jgi:hypothetical protein
MTTTAGVKSKKDRPVHRAGNAVKGARFLAFILTLDGGSSEQNRAGVEAKRSTAELPPLAAGFAFVFLCS